MSHGNAFFDLVREKLFGYVRTRAGVDIHQRGLLVPGVPDQALALADHLDATVALIASTRVSFAAVTRLAG
jgi:hypothetical protein